MAPALAAIGNQTVDELVALGFTATAGDTDVPANVLTFSLAGAVPAGASITSAGVFSWTPTEAQGPGMFTFDVLVTDNGAPNLTDFETIIVTVNEVNVAPVATADTDNTTENASVRTDVLANDTDVDNDDNLANFSLDNVSIGSTTGLTASPVAAGSVSIVANEIVFDPGTALDELDAGDTATVTIDYTMSDDSGAPATSTLLITIAGQNDSPVLDNGSSMTLVPIGEDDVANQGTPVSTILTSGDANPISDLDNSDVQGIAVVSTGGSNTDGWEYSIDAGMTFQSVGTVSSASALLLRTQDVLRYVPDPSGESSGVPAVDFRAWDQTGATADQEGVKVDSASNGGTTPFSTAIGTATLSIGRTTAVLVEGAGTSLLIHDVSGSGKDDRLTLTFDAQTNSLVVADARYIVADLTGTPTTSNSVNVSLVGFTSIVVDLADGDDTLDIDLSGLGANSLDMQVTIFGGSGNDTLTVSGMIALGSGGLSTNPDADDFEDIFVNGTVTTVNGPVVLRAGNSLEVNAPINTGGGVAGSVHLNAGLDVLGNCSLIDAGDAAVEVVGQTGLAQVRVKTTSTVTLDGGSGGIAGCNGEATVEADQLTLIAEASVGKAALQNEILTVVEPLLTKVNRIEGSVGGLGIFIDNEGSFIDNTTVLAAAPLGLKVITDTSASTEGEGSPWQNALNPLDVNSDFAVSPLDALQAINFLNSNGRLPSAMGESAATMYVDVNGDRTVSPLDALLIINHLNRHPVELAVGESVGSYSAAPIRDTYPLVSNPDKVTQTEQSRGPGESSSAIPMPHKSSTPLDKRRWTQADDDEAQEWESLLDVIAEDAAALGSRPRNS